MKKSNLILKMTALPLLTGLALGGWQFVNAAELPACENQSKDSVATASASASTRDKSKYDFSKARREQLHSNAESWAKEKLKTAKPSGADDEPAACIGRCVDKGIKTVVGKTEVQFFESLFDSGNKFERMTPEQEAEWMRACIDGRIFNVGETPAQAKAFCVGELSARKTNGTIYPWTLIITASAKAEVTYIRLCDNPNSQDPASTGTQGTAGENR